MKEIVYLKQNDFTLNQKLLEALIEGGIESIVKVAYDHLQYPVIFLTISFILSSITSVCSCSRKMRAKVCWSSMVCMPS